MERLILFRHADAASRAAGKSDFDRPLSAAGRYDASLMGRVLAAAGLMPDLVLVSSSVRTVETWDSIAPAFPRAKLQQSKALYNASAHQIARAVHAVEDRPRTLMVIGHNPGIQMLALSLAAAGSTAAHQVHEGFPPATAAVFAVDESGRSTCERLLKVKDFGGQA
jgi:phosphohistidine phosphatase